MNEPILTVSDLTVHYGGIEAVKGISLEVMRWKEFHAALHRRPGQTGRRNDQLPGRQHHRTGLGSDREKGHYAGA
jgi:hypothetical protein